tara:strand:+ start:219 stop:449 length:231 start_codon:yes stop_codon:yes gene_type:complete
MLAFVRLEFSGKGGRSMIFKASDRALQFEVSATYSLVGVSDESPQSKAQGGVARTWIPRMENLDRAETLVAVSKMV